MNAEFESQVYVAHHRQLSRSIHRFVQRTLAGMARLQRRQFAAPWTRQPLRYDHLPSSPRT
ncbi:MAG: hypothetical protein PGN16_09955 [Sphingomonas phyllosphaerae]|uniref:hypothetical protein n=1 Tax=Sphingomonas phyllosphaerae TaxID=257003 RepID=UPI002FFCFD78